MRSMQALLARLKQLDIRLWVDGELLRFSAPKDVLTQELKDELRVHKQALIRHFRQAGKTTGAESPPLEHAVRHDDLPLSMSQQRLWFLCRMDNAGDIYNMPLACRLDGPLDPAAFQRSIAFLCQRHEMLRARFPVRQGRPVTEIVSGADHPVPLVDLTPLAVGEQTAAIQKLSAEILDAEFDLAAGPLWRATLVKLDTHAHVLLMAVHHIVFDLWSMGIYMRELSLAYQAMAQGRQPKLNRLEYQYVDFAAWQRRWVEGDGLKQQLSYWTRKLEGAPKLLDLPTDFERPVVHRYKGGTEMFGIDADCAGKLRSFSRQQGATLFMTLLAVYALFLSRYTGQKDIVIGSPIANRNRHRETEAIIGLFVNMLALRVDLSKDPSFEQLVGRVRRNALEAYANQDLPFEFVVDAISPERITSRTPLFQTTFVFQNTPTARQRTSTLALSPLPGDRVTPGSIYDLTLMVQETGDRIMVALEYNRLLFRTQTVVRMRRQLEMLIRQAVDHPQHPLSRIGMLTGQEARTMLREWNRTGSDIGPFRTGHELFESAVERFPHFEAVRYGQETLTYRQLAQQSNQLAWHLKKMGVTPDTIVGLCVERSPQMVIGLMGILKAGGAFLPIDPANPEPRRRFMVENAAVRIMVTQDKLASLFTAAPMKIVRLDADWPRIGTQSRQRPRCKVLPRHLAYVIYTSGSTGKPKGVCLHHEGLVNLSLAQKDCFFVSPGNRVLQFAFFSFDAAVSEVFMTLCAGATLHLADAHSLLPGAALSELLSEQAVTHVTLPPSALSVMRPESFPNLETLIVAGEACPVQSARLWASRFRFINAYGPTETTVCATSGRLDQNTEAAHIGRPIANTRVYLLDETLQPVPIGAVGEIYIGGVGVARGYLNRPGLTAERFVPDPFSFSPGDRLFKTGDMARYFADGRIDFLGRTDHQVKIRGFRIELGEIETALMAHPDMGLCAVGVDGADGDNRLIAFCISKSEKKRSAETMHRFLEQRLPGYMIPSAFLFLDDFPTTPSGKIDRKALMRQAKPAGNGQVPYRAPRNPVEQDLAAIWSQVLDLSPIGIDDNFFYCGGHSLKAVKLIELVQKQLGPVPMAAIFQAPTVAQFAALLKKRSPRVGSSPMVELNARGDKPALFCVHPANGAITCYLEFARGQDGKRKVYAFPAPGLSPETVLPDTVPALAKMYADGVAARAPDAGFVLCGFSTGGAIVHEMACALEAAGMRPAAVLLLDSPAPEFYRRYSDPAVQFLAFVQELAGQHHVDALSYFHDVCRIEPSSGAQALVRAIDSWSENRKWEILNRCARKFGILSEDSGQEAYLRRVFAVFCGLIHALIRYRPPVYGGPVTLFVAQDGIKKRIDAPELGWRRHIKGTLRVVDVPGDHYRMLETPHLENWIHHLDNL